MISCRGLTVAGLFPPQFWTSSVFCLNTFKRGDVILDWIRPPEIVMSLNWKHTLTHLLTHTILSNSESFPPGGGVSLSYVKAFDQTQLYKCTGLFYLKTLKSVQHNYRCDLDCGFENNWGNKNWEMLFLLGGGKEEEYFLLFVLFQD